MTPRHTPFWPKRLPQTLEYPAVPIFRLVEVAAEYYPQKAALNYYGQAISYARLNHDIQHLAGALAERGIAKGDRVAVYMQNSPLYVIAFYAIMRANAVVVPVNPMNNDKELAFILKDSGAAALITTTDLLGVAEKVRDAAGLKFLIAGAYQDYLPAEPALNVPPAMLQAPACPDTCLAWNALLSCQTPPPAVQVGPQDMCLLPYTSGSTGRPKGCVHTNQTVMSNVVSAYHWLSNTASAVHLSVLPFFHVTGLVHSMLAPLYAGAALVLLTRWDRSTALDAIEKYKVTHWINISTMVVDLLSAPDIAEHDLGSLVAIGGGGAPLPEALGRRLHDLTGLSYVEGYGLTETISQTHFNPPDRAKLQCIGIPDFGVDARIVNVETLAEVPPGTPGELVINGPEVLKEYWNRPEETAKAFMQLDGKRFFRTGDICRMDEEGYFFLVDRTKRMINAAGFKVWPAEVENTLYSHPAVKEACVVGVPDPVRVEEVRAYIVLQDDSCNKVTPEDIIRWSKEQMAAYKYPRQVIFVDALPKSGTGKILWRQIQEKTRSEAGPSK
ncbi:MAG: long-chain fatty acid--CoA ligase [Desulfatitalea sp. BRH_c12]|nr:MAG: long-chain fatty acid--CoA ligase [Desulfatitalea sp. BRH_c12]